MLSKSRMDPCRQNRQQILIETNICWLRQALDLLGQIDDQALTGSPKGLPRHRAGAHLRHILEFYDCFLDGVESAHIDYDARRRDTMLEKSPAVAALRIRGIIEQLNDRRLQNENLIVMVRMENADHLGIYGGWLPSSISRELQALSSHTIHHFALISMTLHAQGIELDPSFGMAPSTLTHEAAQSRSAEAA